MLTVEEASGAPVDVWPDNWRAVILFDAVGTQWRAGPVGILGLDYNVLYRKMDRLHLSEPEYDDLENDIRVLEDAALETMRQK